MKFSKKNIKKKYQEIIKNKKYHLIAFLILTVIFFVLFYLFFSLLNFSKMFAFLVSYVFDFFKIPNEIYFYQDYYVLLVYNLQFSIINLCTGIFEISVFLALIFSNLLVSIYKKIIGATIIFIIFIIFNVFRIFTIIYLIGNNNIIFAKTLHDVLFKLSLFLILVIFYYVWLKLSTKKNQKDIYERI